MPIEIRMPTAEGGSVLVQVPSRTVTCTADGCRAKDHSVEIADNGNAVTCGACSTEISPEYPVPQAYLDALAAAGALA